MDALDGIAILFVPGLRAHDPNHWQTHAARALPGSATVEPLRVDGLSRAARVASLNAAIISIPGDIILVAHSAGCLMVAHWAAARTHRVRGALLVTPADIEKDLPAGYPRQGELDANGWLPVPRAVLPFPAIVVASHNDPLCDFTGAAQLARCWGARLHDAGVVGHLNPAAGYGPWADALPLIERMALETAG